MQFSEVVKYLESLTIMPKTMPGLEKIQRALRDLPWFKTLDPKKIIVVAGTNGKGTTCAILETLLMSAKRRVGLYTSPHLIKTTERIRTNAHDISEAQFVVLFLKNKPLIEKYKLSHFESLTLLATDYFFSPEWKQNLDYVILEVGLGGKFDATNAFPHNYSVITALGLDHENILGPSIVDIAENKFGIIREANIVVHHELPDDVQDLKAIVQKNTNSKWLAAPRGKSFFLKGSWVIETPWGTDLINIPGERAVENAMTALTLFGAMNFVPKDHLKCLNKIRWSGRMQKIAWPGISAPVFLSGDHNPQGVDSLLSIMKNYTWETLHLVVGIGQDKNCEEMFHKLLELPNAELHLTETPFKGITVDEYPDWVAHVAQSKNKNVVEILKNLQTKPQDMVLVTGSLYLVGAVLKELATMENQSVQKDF